MAAIDLAAFHVSKDTGFLLEEPLFELPAYFEEWNRIAKNVPDLLCNHRLRHEVDKMRLLDAGQLSGHRQLRLAHLQLSLLGSSYVWQEGETDVPRRFPACLAVPWCHVSGLLGLRPVLCHVDLALANWTRPDPDRPLSLDNVGCFYELPGGQASQWFFVIAMVLETLSGTAARHVVDGAKAVEKGNEAQIIDALRGISDTIRDMKAILHRMHDKLTADAFFNVLRPYLAGWGGESNPMPEGIVYEGVTETPIQCLGSTGAQSPSLQLLDAFLAIAHAPDKEAFMETMRQYMLPAHRNLLLTIKALPNQLSHYVRTQGSERLLKAYNGCLAALADFRSYHVQIVAKYITIPSKRGQRNKGSLALGQVGTAGSEVLPFLKDIRRTTTECQQKL